MTKTDSPSAKGLNTLLLLGIVGFLNSLYTLWHRQGLFINGVRGQSFCAISDTIDCNSVALSRYSSYMGVPTSAYGVAFYSLVIILILRAMLAQKDGVVSVYNQSTKLLLTLSLIGIVPTVGLALVSFFVLKTLCLMCALSYLINFVLLERAWHKVAESSGEPASLGESIKNLSMATWFFMFASLLFPLWLLPQVVDTLVAEAKQMDDGVLKATLLSHLAAEPRTFNLSNAPSVGPENAKLVVVEFSDFQCPYCARSAETIPSLMKAYGDSVRYVFKNYPLSSDCNPNIKHAGHSLACQAAKTGQCVFKLSGSTAFFEYKYEVFAAQSSMSLESLRNTAERILGAKKSELEACVKSTETHQEILDQVAEGFAAKLEGTPTQFLNGRVLASGHLPNVFRAAAELYQVESGQSPQSGP